MGDLIVRPSYQLSERDILTVDKINLMATPVVELSLTDPVNDQNFFRNGNFYSGFWQNAAGINCPAAQTTENADFWLCTPQGDIVNYARDTTVPDLFSLFSARLTGNPNVSSCEFGSRIVGDLAATLRRSCTFSCYIQNSAPLALSPQLNIYTCNGFNDFTNVTLVDTVDLPTIQPGLWGYETATMDLSQFANVSFGLYIALFFPNGSLNGTNKVIFLSRMKFQIGDVATEFSDDSTLFDQVPSVGPSDLQDGCIARPGLFMPEVIPAGAYEPQSIVEADIAPLAIDNPLLADQSVDTRVLADGSVTLPKLAAALLSYLLPSGAIWAFAGPTIPTDWFECDGRALSANDPLNANLFAAIGFTWGGDGIATFNLPDFRSVTLAGAGQGLAIGSLSNRVLGQVFGEEQHQLLTGETPIHNHVATVTDPKHNHTINDPKHSHSVPFTQNAGGGNATSAVGEPGNPTVPTGTSATGITLNPSGTGISVAISNAGGNGQHNNMQPTAIIKWMIKR